MSTALQPIDALSPGANLAAYTQAVSAIPILSADEELEIAEDLYYNESVDAARQLVMSHLRFVIHIAKSYSGYGLPEGDLIQEGNVGLMKAVKRFDPSRGVRLVSFAVHWIKAEMHEYILKNWRIVKVATTKAQRKLFFNLRSQKKKLAWLTHDEATAVAADLGVEVDQVYEMERRLSAHDATFDLGQDDDDDSAPVAAVHYLEDKRYDPAVEVEEADYQEQSAQGLLQAIQQLDERSQDILRQRWLSEEKATLHELADKYGVSAERVRQLEKNAMNKVKGFIQE